jgi:hypothetical protein
MVGGMAQVEWPELNRKMMDPVEEAAAQARAPEQQMVALASPADCTTVDLSPGLLDSTMDLIPYVNTSAFKARACHPLVLSYAQRCCGWWSLD